MGRGAGEFIMHCHKLVKTEMFNQRKNSVCRNDYLHKSFFEQNE
jgi:hypothetical protein